VVLVLLLAGVYSNHFQNEFHFDDFHTITNNPFIRDLHNIPRFFKDPTLFSTMPDHAIYRPVVSTSLAIDYALGHSLKPFFFHLSTFVWMAVLVILLFFFYQRLAADIWVAFFAAAFFAVHPVSAETVNYVIQRGDLYCTLGVVAALLWYIAKPTQRKYGLYLIPAVLAYLSKPPALVFPILLVAYLYLFEERRLGSCLRKAVPALVVTGIAAVVCAAMTPPVFSAGAASSSLYRLTQPWVVLHYFKSFFLPSELSADSDCGYVSDAYATEAVTGFVFVLMLIAAAVWSAKNDQTKPISFGLIWFLVTLAPTALMPLAEVTNDHRMFFAFAGLSIAVFWAGRLLTVRYARHRAWAVVGALLIVMASFASQTRERNRVWHSEESLWQDVTEKSPRNGRGLMNYGLIFMERGDYATALSYYDRALAFTPNYWSLEINLGIANGGLHRTVDAERHFLRAIELAPNMADPYFFYSRWLASVGRTAESAPRLEKALAINPYSFDTRHLLMQVYSETGNTAALDRLVRDTLNVSPGDQVARKFESMGAARSAGSPPTAEELLNQSLKLYQNGKFEDSITSARKALALRPQYAEAYNTLAASYNSLHRWEEGMDAAQEAIRLKPDYELAKNNLLWALAQKTKGVAEPVSSHKAR
jgi:tetratricopeptide (TPR) repeat protein